MSGTDTYLEWDDSQIPATVLGSRDPSIAPTYNRFRVPITVSKTPTIEDLLAELGDKFTIMFRNSSGYCVHCKVFDADCEAEIISSGYHATPHEALKKLLEMLAQ